MSDIYLDQPPRPQQRIRALHVWIATYADGSEGIVSGDVPLPDGLGMRHMPLMSSKREVAEALGDMAQRAVIAAHRAGQPVTVRLQTFMVLP